MVPTRVRLELKTHAELHLKYLATRIDVIDQNQSGIRIAGLVEDRIQSRASGKSAELTGCDTVVATATESCVRARCGRSPHQDIGSIENVEELRRDDQAAVFSEPETLLNSQVDVIDPAIDEKVSFIFEAGS